MPDSQGREHFIPLRRDDLVEWLCADDTLTAEERDQFRRFCRRLAAACHFRFNRRFEEMKAAYDPFDPDTDMRPLFRLSAEQRQQRINAVYRDFAWLMDRANFVHLSREDIEAGLKETSDWGVHMRVDFGAFEHLAIFARGDVMLPRTRRRLRNFYREEQTKVESYQRLVMILKLRPEHCYGKEVNTDCVYLKIFKDVPKLDIKMLLPTARVRMSKFDRGRIGLPLISGIAVAMYNVTAEVLNQIAHAFIAWDNPLLLWGIASGGITYGYRSYYGYQQMKQRYHLTLTQSLYYQNLDSNAGVLYRLFDEAEEQECREGLLAFFLLWKKAGPEGWTAHDLAGYVEPYLEKNVQCSVDFETSDALLALEKLRLIERNGDRYRARPIEDAMQYLAAAWGSWLQEDVKSSIYARLRSQPRS
jgi:hypothetical protein